MVLFQYAEKLPAHRTFGRRRGGWGDGQIVLTGDEVRAVELWWTNANEVSAKARARWSLCIPLQFIEGFKLVHQKVKVLWLEPTKIMLEKRMIESDLYGHDLYGGEGWYITGHVSTVDIGSSWLPARGVPAPRSLADIASLGQDTVALIGVSVHDMEKRQVLLHSRAFEPDDDVLEVTAKFFRTKGECPLLSAVAKMLEASPRMECIKKPDLLNRRDILPHVPPSIVGILSDWTSIRVMMNDWFQFGARLRDGREVRAAAPYPPTYPIPNPDPDPP